MFALQLYDLLLNDSLIPKGKGREAVAELEVEASVFDALFDESAPETEALVRHNSSSEAAAYLPAAVEGFETKASPVYHAEAYVLQIFKTDVASKIQVLAPALTPQMPINKDEVESLFSESYSTEARQERTTQIAPIVQEENLTSVSPVTVQRGLPELSAVASHEVALRSSFPPAGEIMQTMDEVTLPSTNVLLLDRKRHDTPVEVKIPSKSVSTSAIDLRLADGEGRLPLSEQLNEAGNMVSLNPPAHIPVVRAEIPVEQGDAEATKPDLKSYPHAQNLTPIIGDDQESSAFFEVPGQPYRQGLEIAGMIHQVNSDNRAANVASDKSVNQVDNNTDVSRLRVEQMGRTPTQRPELTLDADNKPHVNPPLGMAQHEGQAPDIPNLAFDANVLTLNNHQPKGLAPVSFANEPEVDPQFTPLAAIVPPANAAEMEKMTHQIEVSALPRGIGKPLEGIKSKTDPSILFPSQSAIERLKKPLLPPRPSSEGEVVIFEQNNVQFEGPEKAILNSDFIVGEQATAQRHAENFNLKENVGLSAIRAAEQSITSEVQFAERREAVLLAVSKAVIANRFPVEITLDPPELGQVRIAVQPMGEQQRLVIQVERPEVLELVKQNTSLLLEAMPDKTIVSASVYLSSNSQAGLLSSDAGTQGALSFMSGGGHHHSQGQGRGENTSHMDTAQDAPVETSTTKSSSASVSLDIKL